MKRFLFFIYLATIGIQPAWAESLHQPLKFKNDFKDPKEVVSYYCARDASGFVWSGLLEIERKAFTAWKQIPRTDSFLIARNYQVQKAQIEGNRATVWVQYELVGVGDAFGTRAPAAQQIRNVEFQLQKIDDQWKIITPAPNEIQPVVMESKFPMAAAR